MFAKLREYKNTMARGQGKVMDWYRHRQRMAASRATVSTLCGDPLANAEVLLLVECISWRAVVLRGKGSGRTEDCEREKQGKKSPYNHNKIIFLDSEIVQGGCACEGGSPPRGKPNRKQCALLHAADRHED